MAKLDFNSFYESYQKDPNAVVLEMVSEAASCILDNIQMNRITITELLKDEIPPCEICDLMGWPALMDNGMFDKCAEVAIQLALAVSGYKYDYKTTN